MDLIRGSIGRPVTVSMFVVAVMLFGVVSLQRLPLNLLPDLSYPSLTIQTDYEDSAPEEVESLITRPVEEAVGVLPGLTRMSSVSRAGQSEVVLEFSWGTNMDVSALEAREKLDLVQFPRDARRPVLLRFDPSNDPILRVQLWGDVGLSRLRYTADKELRKYLESAEGVAAIKIVGGLEEQIQIEIDEKRLAELNIPIAEVVRILTEENLNQASGRIYNDDANYLVRVMNQFRSVEEIERIIVRDRDGRRVVLSEVATVRRAAKDREAIARVNGRESVEMAIYKEGDANTVRVARAVEGHLKRLKTENRLPAGTDYQIVFNQADFIQQSIDDVLSSALIGGVLATVILFLFLQDFRSTVTIAATIPIAIMATFALMYQTGISLNLMSLGGVALGVGMLVDNAIVVLEAVHRHRESRTELAQAVYLGTREVSKAVTASTLTTVAVFVPLIFVEGIAGQLFRDQALTITFALLASLAVAVTLIPMILAFRMRPLPEPEPKPVEPEVAGKPVPAWQRKLYGAGHFLLHQVPTVVTGDVRRAIRSLSRGLGQLLAPVLDYSDAIFLRLRRAYPALLTGALDRKSAVFGLMLVLALAAGIMMRQLGGELIPPVTQGEFYFEIELPQGTPISTTEKIFREIEEEVRGYPGVGTVFSSIGRSNRNQFARQTVEEHTGQLYVMMADRGNTALEHQAIERLRRKLDRVPDAASNFFRPTFFSLKTPVEVEIYAYDLDVLRDTADRVAAALAGVPGLSDLKTSTRMGNPEIQVRFDRLKLARLGLDEAQAANLIRSKIRGDVASRYREEDKQIEILVRADASDRTTIADIENLILNAGPARAGGSTAPNQPPGQDTRNAPQTPAAGPANGPPGQEAAVANSGSQPFTPVRLGAVATVEVARGPSEVRRIQSQRAAVVSGNIAYRDLSSITEDIRQELSALRRELPPDVSVGIGGQNDEMTRSQESLQLALGLAVFLVYLVMASQFESLVHPFIILFSIPLGLIGVVFALFVTATTISVMVFLGVIILAGIVVNNAIVLIDFTNQLRGEGLSVREALVRAGETRLRPILMTTLTTVLGLIPMAIGWGEGAEIRAPMAITVIGGLTFSTALTLIFIPVAYELVAGRRMAVTAPVVPSPAVEAPHQGA